MKMKSIVFWTLTVFATVSCTSDLEDNGAVVKEMPALEKTVTFSGGMDGVSVLAFQQKNGGEFLYKETVAGTWVNNRIETIMEIGKYKFLFSKTPNTNTSFYPASLVIGNTKLEDTRFEAKPDPQRGGYVLSVDEIFLQETPELAKEIYHIVDSTTIRAELKRAVSQATLIVKRGYRSNTGYTELPFSNGESIVDHIETINLDIKGVGNSLNIDGGLGSVNTYYSVNQSDSIIAGGFAHYTGPFVFPNETGANSEIDITIYPTSTSLFPVTTGKVLGVFERNRKLEITLWVTATYELITVTVRTAPITAEDEGDEGIWD